MEHNIMKLKILVGCLLTAISMNVGAIEVPRHVELAVTLLDTDVNNVSTYSAKGKSGVTFPEYGKTPKWRFRGSTNTNAVGFINALVDNSRSLVNVRQSISSFDDRNLDYYWNSIAANKNGFRQVNVDQLLIGDFIVFKCNPKKVKCGNPVIADTGGHIALVINTEEIAGFDPIVNGTRQVMIKVLDVAFYNHGPGDSRLSPETNGRSMSYTTGIGTGYIRVYIDAAGRYIGSTNSTSGDVKWIDSVGIITGRPS